MNGNFDRDKKSIKEIYDSFKKSELVIDYTYQRRKVWLEQDKIRLIETILLDQIVPEVFFWKSSVDPETGVSVTHIVDGQQRINAIVEFIDGDYKLSDKSLLSDEVRERAKNKGFSELSDDDKALIWTYKLCVVDIDRKCGKDKIKQMFRRLNLTNYSLNEPEKRHVIGGEFGAASETLATDDFWGKHNVFSPNDVRRMLDVEFCCSVYILADIGLVSEIGQKKIGEYYEDYKTSFDYNKELYEKIKKSMDMIDSLTDKQTLFFISKKAQIFSLFSVMLAFIENGVCQLSDLQFKKFKNFVIAYDSYNDHLKKDLEELGYAESIETIETYKSASSEGVNRLKNRVLRAQILQNILESDNQQLDNGFLEIIRREVVYTSKYQQLNFLNDDY